MMMQFSSSIVSPATKNTPVVGPVHRCKASARIPVSFALLAGVFLFSAALFADPSVPVQSGNPVNPAEVLTKEAQVLEQRADSLLKLDPTAQKEEILKMSDADAKALMNTLSRRLVQRDPDAGAVLYLYEHLASVNAIELSEKRLERLLAVFVVTLLLFVGYLVFLLVQQNRIVRSLRSRPESSSEKSSAPVSMYRGE